MYNIILDLSENYFKDLIYYIAFELIHPEMYVNSSFELFRN